MATPTVSQGTRIQLCGRLSIELAGEERAGALRGRQVPLLLAYLVLNRDRAVGREELIGALWPRQAPRSQDAALRTLLSRLRSALGSDVLSGRDELGLELPEPTWVDVEAAAAHLQRALDALERHEARQAWALAQVPLNIAGRGLLPGSEAAWLEARRRELDDIRLQALEVIGRAGLALGTAQLGSVERAARALIEAEPYRESGYVLLMGALEAQGNVAEALRAFERLRTLLRDELGIAPSPDAIAAHERLLRPAPDAGSEDRATGDGRAPGTSGEAVLALPAELQSAATAAMVGREDELAQLHAWLVAAHASEGERLMLLGGDAGVGKTRLLAELAARAHDAGTVVLAGRAADQSLVAFQPFLEALGHYVRAAAEPELRFTARRSGPELARLIPELRRRVPDLPPPETGDVETERYRLFEAVVELLRELSAAAPVLIVLDDLHWADRPTLMLLRHLGRAFLAGPVAIIGAHRSGEETSEGFEATLAGLRHERLLRQMEVRGLPEAEARRLVGIRVGEAPSADFARALYRETEGNPFFIEEIVRHLTDAGVQPGTAGAHELHEIGLPDDVREVIERRLSRLGDASVELLRVASVIGRDFDAGLLERVLGFDEERFLRALEEAIAAGLISEGPALPDRYAFVHALIRETLYGGMSAARRARVHRRVGLALEEQPAAPTGVLALHFARAAQAQDAERAVRYSLQAGHEAAAMLAHDQAAEHYENALTLLERFAPDDRAQRCELLLDLGAARIRSGERPRAWRAFRQAATLASELRDSDSLARAAIGASRRFVQPPGVVDEELIALLEEALALTPAEPTVTRVRLLSCLCAALYFSDRGEEMRRLSAAATVLAAELGDARAIAIAAAARRRAYWGPGHLERRLADSTQLLSAAREAGDVELVLQGHAWLVVDLLETGDRAAVEAQIEAFTAGARTLREPLFEWQITVWQAMRALLAGQLDDAERLAGDALASGARSEGVTAPQYYAIQLLTIRREQLRLAELETAARGLLETNPGRPAWRAALALMLAESDRSEEAVSELHGLAAGGLADIPRDGDWLITMMTLAETAVSLRDTERAELVLELLAPQRSSHVVIGLAAVCLGCTARYLGRLAATVGDRAGARRHLEFALRANQALGATLEVAHTQLDLASVVTGRGQSRELVAAAAATAEQLTAPRLTERIRRLQSA